MHKLHLCYACAIGAIAAAKQQSSSVMPASMGGEGALRYRARKKVKNWMRELKASMSSDFEQAFLKATRPDSQAPKPKHVESIALSIGAFEAYTSPSCDPYGSLLHKAWSRCAETDARSTTKAIYVLHRLASSPACCGEKEFAGLANAYRELCSDLQKNSHALFRPESCHENARAPKRRVLLHEKMAQILRKVLRLRRRLLALRGLRTAGIRARGLRGFIRPPRGARRDTMRALPAPPRDNPSRRGRSRGVYRPTR